MRRRVMVVVLSVCVSVYLLPRNLLHTSFIRQKHGVIGFFMVFSRFCHVAFAENASFKSYGIIYWPLPPSSLPKDISMDKKDSNNFFSTRRVCTSSNSSQYTTDSSTTGVNCLPCFLRFSNLGVLRGVKGERLPALTLYLRYFGLGLTASWSGIVVGRTKLSKFNHKVCLLVLYTYDGCLLIQAWNSSSNRQSEHSGAGVSGYRSKPGPIGSHSGQHSEFELWDTAGCETCTDKNTF